MRRNLKKILSLLLTLALVLGLFPTIASAAGEKIGTGEADKVDHVFTDADNAILNDDVFARIDAVKNETASAMGGLDRMTEQDYIAIEPRVIAAIKSSDTYVEGTLQQNGNFLVWETTTGMPCCYDPRMEAELHNTANDPTPEEIAKAQADAEALVKTYATRGGGPTSVKIGLIQPYWESTSSYSDSSFNDYSPYYKSMWQNLYGATGGSGMRYSMTNATVDNIASTVQQCAVVIFDSHGTTDYSGSNEDYTSRANCSYLCLTTNSGITSADTAAQTGEFGTFYHALTGSGYAYVSGTCIANHMTANAPHSLVYMGICLGMATDGMQKGLRNKGVEVVYGYSQSVTFTGERDYMQSILGYVKDGETFGAAVTQTKAALGNWDPAYSSYSQSQAVANHAAFPIAVSSEDAYPGHGNVDAVHPVNSTWSLFGTNYNVTASSNNMAWGTVTVNGSLITAVPAEGYYAAGYTVLSGTAEVTQNGNNFSVNASSDCEIQINFAAKTPATVTYVSGGTTIGTEATYLGDSVTLPASATEIPEWTFIGWLDDQLAATDVKPVFYRPGDTYTVNTANPTLYALFKHVEGNGGVCYERVVPNRGAMDGVYVITSSTASSMYVMNGVSGSVNIESGSQGYTALANTGIELEDNVLREVDDAYLFEVVNQSGESYSFRSVTEGSYLAVYNSYLWTRASYESAYCDWSMTVSDSGVTMWATNAASYPYLSWSGSKWAASSSTSSVVQLWRQTESGDTYYATNPVVEEHTHEMSHTPATAPTCTTPGNTEYYRCSICFKYFSDAAGENEITGASTVLNALGHNYEGVVTAPTELEQGYTTYTCTRCGDTYVDDYVPALGTNYTVSFSVPAECEMPDDMICNTNTGITLPVIEAPEGYKFLGWVDDIYDNVDAKPDGILTGHYVAPHDITLFALFKYVVDDGSGEGGAFELVSEALDDWTGNYVITYNKTTSLYAMKGMSGGTSYETNNNGSSVTYASTGMTLEDNALTNVPEDYVFEVKQEASGNYSIQSVKYGSYVGIQSSTLYALASYGTSTSDWSLSWNSNGNTDAYLVAGGSYPYIAFSTYSYKFWCNSSNNGICFWKETAAGTPYWTTVIGEPDPGVDYTVTFTTPAGVTAPAAMIINSVAGATLPTVVAPEGYTFLGWVLDDYDNVSVKPGRIYTGKFRPQADTTLKALFTYVGDDTGIGYELVTEDQADWSGNYVITCNTEPGKMIVLGSVAGGNTYEAAGNGGAVLFANTGMSLNDNVLTNPANSYIFQIEPQSSGYTIKNLANNAYVGRNVTTTSQSARLHSYASYEANYCRWSFTFGEHGNTASLYNVMIEHVNDAGLDGSYPYLGCGYYYFFSETEHSESYPYFWVDGTGETYDSDVYYMYLWKETEVGTRYYTTVIGEPAHEHTPAEPVQENVVAATCTEAGSYDSVVYCAECGEELSRETVTVPALGHAYGAPTYEWAADNSTVTAAMVCANDASHVVTETVNTTYEVTLAPTATTDGEGTWTAVFTNEAFETQTKTEVLPATGPTEPIEDSDLTLSQIVKLGAEMIVRTNLKKDKVDGKYESFYIELITTDEQGNEINTRYSLDNGLTNGNSNYMVYYDGFKAKMMRTEYVFQVHAFDANGQEYVGPELRDSMQNFLLTVLRDEGSGNNKRTLAADMLNYGAAAQTYLQYDVEHLANEAGLSAEDIALLNAYATVDVEPVANSIISTGSGAEFVMSASMKNRIILKLRAQLGDAGENVKLRVTNQATGEEEYVDTTKNNNNYTALFDNVGASKMRTRYNFVMVNGDTELTQTMDWSMAAFLMGLHDDPNSSDAIKDLSLKMLKYGDSAAAYLADPEN